MAAALKAGARAKEMDWSAFARTVCLAAGEAILRAGSRRGEPRPDAEALHRQAQQVALGRVIAASLPGVSAPFFKEAMALVDEAPLAPDRPIAPEDLGVLYQAMLELEPSMGDAAGVLALAPAARGRRRGSGAYYTPAELIDDVLAHSLAPALDARLAGAEGSAEVRRRLDGFRVSDPACGAGAFLLASARMIAARLEQAGEDDREALEFAANTCLYGVDLDATAAELAMATLWLAIGKPGLSSRFLDGKIKQGDSLLGAPVRGGQSAGSERDDDAWVGLHLAPDGAGGGTEARRFHWRREFPEAFAGAAEGGFDAVVGNPPFQNGIESPPTAGRQALMRALHPDVRGAADLASYFVSLATQLARPGGWIGLVTPRPFLAARSADRLRANLAPERSPRHLFATESAKHFQGAAVFIAGVCLGPAGECSVALGRSPASARKAAGMIRSANWWREMQRLLAGDAHDLDHAGRIGEHFEVGASMTAGEAYALKSALVDRENGDELKLVTTGLIEPGECLWGRAKCRYLKADWRHPRIAADAELPGTLMRRLEAARRPKILVAGLSARLECFLDANGEYAGAVSTYVIRHPEDDVTALAALADHLNSESVTQRFRAELGGAALGGGNITVQKRFLQNLPWTGQGEETGTRVASDKATGEETA